jgi:hypothetical protein
MGGARAARAAEARAKRRPTARELETDAAGRRVAPAAAAPSGEAAAMLARRGFRPTRATPDLPFPEALDGEAAERLVARLHHYGFRLFLRGAIQRPGGFAPAEATRYLTPSQSKEHAEALAVLGLATRLPRGRYRLAHAAASFGGTLEWYVARELRRRLGFDVATGLKFRVRGVGGDLDVVAAAEGRLVYMELKSSPPKHLSIAEVAAFYDRLEALRPHVGLFVMDTALRLADKVVPMLVEERRRRGGPLGEPRRVVRELWALTPRLYAVNAKPDLVGNIARALAEGLLALSPAP